jgi:PAS domain S-box-containing protein
MHSSDHPARLRSSLTEWLLLALALMTLGGTLAVWYSLESARVTTVEQERLNALSKILVKEVSVNLVAVNNALAGIIRDRLDEGAPVDRMAVGARLRALVEAMPGIRGLIVLDANGDVIAAIPNDLVGRNFAQRAYFTEPRLHGDQGTLYISPPFRSIRGDIVMCITRIIPGPGGFNGVVTAVLDPGYFSDILQTAVYAADLRAAVTHDSGGAFVHAGTQAAGTGAAPQLRAGGAIVPVGLHTDTGMSLTLQRRLASVQDPLNRQARAFGAVCAALAVLGGATLAWSQGRRRRLLHIEHERERERVQTDTIKASEARFRTLIEEAPVAIAIARKGRFIYTNRRYNLLHGHAADDSLTGLQWQAMIAPDSLGKLHEQQRRIEADAAVEQRFEAIGLCKGDIPIPVLKATTRVSLSDGAATLIFVHDITAQKYAESNLLEARDTAQAANRSKAEFLANMSHEIRTPLNAILGMAYLLERGSRDTDASTMLRKIRTAGRSLLGIINDILDVSKIEAGAMVIERSWFELQDVIDAVAATMGVAAGHKPIALLVRPLPQVAAAVLGDALRIEQLLVNLTSNAIKFTETGSVELAVKAQILADGQATLLFRVTDTGIGIAAAQQDAIFAPFTQADSSTTRRYGGSGLGLTICKQIVTLMDGEIGMYSTEGAGSTFWFALTLPVRPAAASCSAPDMVNLEVLVVATCDPVHNVLVDTARALDWRVRSTDSHADVPTELCNAPRDVRPGAVVLDWQADGAACLATAGAIGAEAGLDGCAIVVLMSPFQAVAFETDAARGLVDALLTKPVTASTLYNAVLEAKRNRSAQGVPVGTRLETSRLLPGIRILVVDDSGINRDVAEQILAEEGALVTLADNGRTAVDWLLAHPGEIDLVLMDVQMPVMDGIEATRILRSMPQFATLPIVALTAGAFSSHQEAARNAGMDHFIAKPFDIPLTIELIRQLTGASATAPLAPALALPAPAAGAGVLDLRRGLKIWGTRENFQHYLRKFAAAYSDVAVQIRRHAAIGNTAVAVALSHKLAGAAANVALPAVAGIARRLESALLEPVAGALLLQELDVAMGAALDATADYAPPPAVDPPSAATLAPDAALAPLIAHMIAALEEGMPESALAALAGMAPHVPPALLAPIAACIDDFDWPGATRHTTALAGLHDMHLPNSPCL